MKTVFFALLTFLGGTLIAFINSKLSNGKAKDSTNALLVSAFLRQILNIAYLTAVFFIFRNSEIKILWPLLGAAIGLTVPSAIITVKMMNRISKGDRE